ncbi:GATA zinc finger-domain-containing protein [Sporodiniella umbellata]|nr:GATA zinc finger-domain-containing protein [Sporodiniella umbellata]
MPSLAELANVHKINPPNIYQEHSTHSYHYPTSSYNLPPPTSAYRDTGSSGYVEPEDDGYALLKQAIEQCITINKEVTRYRRDPLTEGDRNKIMNSIYHTTEAMLGSLKTVCEQIYTSNEHDAEPSNPLLTTPPKEDANSSKYEMIRQARNLQNNSIRPKYRRRNKRSMIGQRCHSCNTTETPEWRRGPDGARTLCNACGLHYSKLIRKGSLTVQSHHLLPLSPDTKPPPRIMQFPIVQVQTNEELNDTTRTPPNFFFKDHH